LRRGWHGAAGLSRSAGAPGTPPAANDSELHGGEGALRERPAEPGQDPRRPGDRTRDAPADCEERSRGY